MSGSINDNAFESLGTNNYNISKTNYITTGAAYIGSKTNEIVSNAGAKSFSVDFSLETASTYVSPTIDMDGTNLVVYSSVINNDSTNEYTNEGSALTKYVSKSITLADGLDSEDLKVYLTGYKPSGTDIEIYAKFKNSADPEAFLDKTWTQLEQLTPAGLYSDTVNRYDYKEYEYGVSNTLESTLLDGAVSVTSGSAAIAGSSTTLDTDLDVGDYVEVYKDASTFFISRVETVTDETNIVLAENIPFTDTAAIIKKIDIENAGYNNVLNDGIIQYYNTAGSLFETYKVYALKIVLKSSSTHLVPRLKDIRALALSV